MSQLLEDRLRELSSHDLDVWLYDVKRNSAVEKGRRDRERERDAKDASVLDVDADPVAPFAERYCLGEDGEGVTKALAVQVSSQVSPQQTHISFKHRLVLVAILFPCADQERMSIRAEILPGGEGSRYGTETEGPQARGRGQ